MTRIWNYFFYSTWQLNFAIGNLMEVPIHRLSQQIPFMRKNSKEKREGFHRLMHDLDSGINVELSFRAMFMSTAIVYSIVFLILVTELKINVKDTLYYYAILNIGLAYLTNHFFLFRADIYKKYFKEFDKIQNKTIIYLSAIFFHLGAYVFSLLLIYFTTGFNLP